MKITTVRKPLTDINNRDFMTGELVKAPKINQEKNLTKKIAKRKKEKNIEAKKMGRKDWKIFVEWFWWVQL